MVPDRQKVWTDGRMEWTDGRTDDAKTISLRLRRGITIRQLQMFVSKTMEDSYFLSVRGLTGLIKYA